MMEDADKILDTQVKSNRQNCEFQMNIMQELLAKERCKKIQ